MATRSFLLRSIDRYVEARAALRARLGLRPRAPWFHRPNAHETSFQVSLGVSLALVFVLAPMTIQRFSNAKTTHQPDLATTLAPTPPSATIAKADEDAAVLMVLNERRRAAGKPPIDHLHGETAMSEDLWRRCVDLSSRHCAEDRDVHGDTHHRTPNAAPRVATAAATAAGEDDCGCEGGKDGAARV